jgi:hypothetical protein
VPAEAWVGMAAILLTLMTGAVSVIYRLSSATTEFKLIGQQQAREISKITESVEKMEVAVVAIAVDRERAAMLERRVEKLERWYDELRRGIGVISKVS